MLWGLSCVCRMLSRVPGQYPLDTSSTPPSPNQHASYDNKNISRHFQTSLGGRSKISSGWELLICSSVTTLQGWVSGMCKLVCSREWSALPAFVEGGKAFGIWARCSQGSHAQTLSAVRTTGANQLSPQVSSPSKPRVTHLANPSLE